MRILMQQVFDSNIAGNATTWYTPAEYNSVLGTADALVIQGIAGSVTGTSPTLSLSFQYSGNNQHWIDDLAINAQPLSNNAIYEASRDSGVFGGSQGHGVLLAHVRLAITLGGTNPACRLKISVCGRAY